MHDRAASEGRNTLCHSFRVGSMGASFPRAAFSSLRAGELCPRLVCLTPLGSNAHSGLRKLASALPKGACSRVHTPMPRARKQTP
ncbi:MAG: hypothetical protein AMXMBFR84_07260 [Candidatus Hydrogenedentota bacterium]